MTPGAAVVGEGREGRGEVATRGAAGGGGGCRPTAKRRQSLRVVPRHVYGPRVPPPPFGFSNPNADRLSWPANLVDGGSVRYVRTAQHRTVTYSTVQTPS